MGAGVFCLGAVSFPNIYLPNMPFAEKILTLRCLAPKGPGKQNSRHKDINPVSMKKKTTLSLLSCFALSAMMAAQPAKQEAARDIRIPDTYRPVDKKIYHKGWIDFNKNGRLDVYEDPSQPVERRIDDLLAQMTMEEKTCQMVTLYGYGRVLKDDLPTPEWKTALWKDGIGAIDEHLNGFRQWGFPFGQSLRVARFASCLGAQ